MTGTYAEWMIFGLILFVVTMLIVAMAFEHKAEVEKARANEAIEKLCDLLYVLDHAHIETGVCCCGDNMQGHDPGYNCGHSPLDMWDYHGEPVLEAARVFARQYKPDV